MRMPYLPITRFGPTSCVLVSAKFRSFLVIVNSRMVDNEPGQCNDTREEGEQDQEVLAHLQRRIREGKFISIGELRDVLRRAAALLCRTINEQCAIVPYLVGVPFAIFTKQSIKLGVSLWLGVINENASMEPKIVAAIAEEWEKTVRKREGVFSAKLQY